MNRLSAAEEQRVKGQEFGICLYINSNTGKVDEVKFDFVTFNPYVTIPPRVFRKIEVEIKKYIWFIPTAEGRKLNYIFYGYSAEPVNSPFSAVP